MRVLVSIQCNTSPLDVQLSDTIKDLMDILQLKFDIPVNQQRLYWGTRRLGSSSTLAEYRIHAEAKITLICSRTRTRVSSGSFSPLSTSSVPRGTSPSRGFEIVKVHISGIRGSCLCVLSAESSNTIESMKLLIHERRGIDPSEQKLFERCLNSEAADIPGDFEMVGRLANDSRLGLSGAHEL